MSETTKRITEIIDLELMLMPIPNNMRADIWKVFIIRAREEIAKAIATHLHQEVIRGKIEELKRWLNIVKPLLEDDEPNLFVKQLTIELNKRIDFLTAELEGE